MNSNSGFSITRLLGIPLGYVMWAIFRVIPNYGIALFVFTVLTRLIMIPMTINQQKSSAKMAAMQPEINEIREKYKSNQEKMNEEMTKIYQREKYNPMSGCLPILIQFPILMGLIDVIYRPLTHLVRMPKPIINKAISAFNLLGFVVPNPNMLELEVIRNVAKKPVFFSMLGAGALANIVSIDYTFLGMDLMLKPSMNMITGIFKGDFNIVILIPILSGITAFLSSKITMKNTATPAAGDPSGGMMKGMMFTMPLMSFWIAFSVPAGVGLYWVYSNILAIVQGYFMNKFFNPNEIREKMKADVEARKEEERQKRLEAKKLMKEGKLSDDQKEKAMTQKQIDRAKLAEARKRDALKYGDVYDEEEEI